MIRIDTVTTFARARQATRQQVEALAASIREVGLLNPITVQKADTGHALIAGLHRLEACKSLGWTEIPATVLDLDEHRRVIAECDENLCAPSLTPVERAEFTRRRKDAYEALHPETRREATLKKGDEVPSRQVGETGNAARFTADTAASTGQSERVVQRDAERGSKVCDEALALIRGTRLDTGRYLDEIKNLAPDAQAARVKADLAAPAPQKPVPVELTPADKVRREIARLTDEAKIDEIVGLRADLVETRLQIDQLKAERDHLKSKLAEALQGDLGRALGNAQRRADAADGRMKEYMATAKRLEFKLKKAEARVRELEDTPIQMDAA